MSGDTPAERCHLTSRRTNARHRDRRSPVGRRRQGKGHRPARRNRRLRGQAQRRQQRRPHRGGGWREVRAQAPSRRHPLPERHPGDRQRRGGEPGGTVPGDRRSGGPRPGLLPPEDLRQRAPGGPVPPDHGQGHRTLPGQARHRHHRPRDRTRLHGQGGPPGHPRAGPLRRVHPAPEDRRCPAAEERAAGQALQPPFHHRGRDRRVLPGLRRPAAPHGGGHHHPAQRRPGCRQGGADGGRPGHLPGRGPRHLPVRHLLQPDGGRGLRGRGNRPHTVHPHDRDRQGLHHAGGCRPVPHRALR